MWHIFLYKKGNNVLFMRSDEIANQCWRPVHLFTHLKQPMNNCRFILPRCTLHISEKISAWLTRHNIILGENDENVRKSPRVIRKRRENIYISVILCFHRCTRGNYSNNRVSCMMCAAFFFSGDRPRLRSLQHYTKRYYREKFKNTGRGLILKMSRLLYIHFVAKLMLNNV